MKVLLPVDGSDYTKRMLAYIAAHDELLGKGHEYIALTVVPALPSHVTRFVDRKTVDEFYNSQAEAALSTVKAFAEQNGWKISLRHAVGVPAEVISETADADKVNLVVMGSHGHSSLGNMVLGSVATGVLARSRAPVLIVR